MCILSTVADEGVVDIQMTVYGLGPSAVTNNFDNHIELNGVKKIRCLVRLSRCRTCPDTRCGRIGEQQRQYRLHGTYKGLHCRGDCRRMNSRIFHQSLEARWCIC